MNADKIKNILIVLECIVLVKCDLSVMWRNVGTIWGSIPLQGFVWKHTCNINHGKFNASDALKNDLLPEPDLMRNR